MVSLFPLERRPTSTLTSSRTRLSARSLSLTRMRYAHRVLRGPCQAPSPRMPLQLLVASCTGTSRSGPTAMSWSARVMSSSRRSRRSDHCDHEGEAPATPPGPHTFHVTIDALGRPLHDLRISVTDRCNFRCVYCMPKEIYGRGYQFLPKDQLLTFEELGRIARVFASVGTRKIRLTGGEPLMRRGLEILVADLATIPEVEVTLTTNGALLADRAQALRDAGLDRITVSLDALDDEVFKCMNDVDFPVAKVLAGIEAAERAGLPVKVNMVVRRGLNENAIVPMARFFREKGHILRF